MPRSPRALLLLSLLAALPATSHTAAACHAGSWDYGATRYYAVLTWGDTGVGLYARGRTAWREADGSYGCEGMSWQDRCTMGVGPFLVVPETYVVAPDRPECLVGAWDVGVYVNDIMVGTEALP